MVTDESKHTNARIRRKRRDKLLEALFGGWPGEKVADDYVKSVRIDKRTQRSLYMIRQLQRCDTWKYLPEQVIDAAMTSHTDFADFMKTGDVEELPTRVLLAMAIEFAAMYLLSANPHNREQMRMWADIDGRMHSYESLHARVLQGALLERDMRGKQIEDAMSGGIPQTDGDFIFDD